MRRTALLALMPIAVAACGSDSPTTSPPATSTVPTTVGDTLPTTVAPPTTAAPPIEFELPTDPDAVVLRYDIGVNQPDSLAISGSIPVLSLYADGRVIIAPEYTDPGEVPVLEQARITPDAVRELVRQAIERGALEPPPPREPGGDDEPEVADVDSYSSTIRVASSNQGTVERTRFDEMATTVQRIVLSWDSVGDVGVVESLRPYHGESLLVIVDANRTPGPNIPFDLAARLQEYEARAGSVWCVELTGAEAETVRADVDAAESAAGWPFSGSDYRLALRPTLPDEPGCAVLSER